MLGTFQSARRVSSAASSKVFIPTSYQTSIGVKVDKKVRPRDRSRSKARPLGYFWRRSSSKKCKSPIGAVCSAICLVVDGTRRNTLDEALALNQRVTDTGLISARQSFSSTKSIWPINGKSVTTVWLSSPKAAGKSCAPARRPAKMWTKHFRALL